MYVRLEIEGAPCELLDNFDPDSPLVVGGLLKGEDQIGYVQTRLKKHRFGLVRSSQEFIVFH